MSRNDGQCHDDRPKGSPTGGGGGMESENRELGSEKQKRSIDAGRCED